MKNEFALASWWKHNISLASLGSSLFSAFFIAALEIVFVISFAALIYSGDLLAMLPQALGFIIFGDAVLCFVVALLSSINGVIAIEQDAPGVMLSVVAAGIISALHGQAEAQFATVTIMVILTSMVTGLLLIALGVFNLGGLVRFLPYPIIGGFLAGTGWLLISGGLGLMVSLPAGLAWFQPGTLVFWVPGALLAAAVYLTTRKVNWPLTIPVMMLAAGLLFYVVIRLLGIPVEQAQKAGWLLDAGMSSGAWHFPLNGNLLRQVDWHVLLGQVPALIPVAVISVIALLLNSSGLELITKKDTDLNRELVTVGIGNLAAGLSGGLVGYTTISFSALNYSMSGGKRIAALLSSVILASTLLFGTSAIFFIPKFIFGAVLIFLGLSLLVEWVYDAWFKFPRLDFMVVVIILTVIVFRGFLVGIVIGLALAVILFAVSYSQVRVITYSLSGREFHSRVTRSLPDQQVLETHGSQIHILKLEGYIFFGTANGLLTNLRKIISSTTLHKIKYVVLDFSKVSGLDSTAMLSFSRMVQWMCEDEVKLVFTGLNQNMRSRLEREVLPAEECGDLRFYGDLDHGLESCENAILAENTTGEFADSNLAARLAGILPGVDFDSLLPYLRRQELATGDYLMREGDDPDLMYFVESGQVTAQLETPDNKKIRLETLRGGGTIGEMGFYTHKRRTASIVVDEPSVVYSLSTEDLTRMEAESPQSANIFHRLIVLLLSDRVTHLTRTVRALERS